jgi:SAM-dependent methyltransferase
MTRDQHQIESEAKDVIATFYDRHPYPPPRFNLDADQEQWREPSRRRAEYHLLFPRLPFREDLDVLIAGCGTSQAARQALRWPDGRVVGIDVSETSLRHTRDLKRRYNLDNLEVHHLPIERVGELGRRFDLIVCTGVLHHLADPDTGLLALREALRPDGALHLMVYARYGRHGITLFQEYAARLGIGTSERDVRDLAHTLAEIPPDHPLVPLLRHSPDFQRTDALADALLNPRERSYSVPELFAFLERSRVSFGRWYRQAPYLPQCGSPSTTPHAPLLQVLPSREQSAAVELFRGSMTRHTLIAHTDDGGPVTDRAGLHGNRWQDVVPIRLPHTISVEERLPPGAAAVLINQAHAYPDLIMPISEPEKLMFDAIDGRRTISQIATETGPLGPGLANARLLFERLWWYDQVVFDASMVT